MTKNTTLNTSLICSQAGTSLPQFKDLSNTIDHEFIATKFPFIVLENKEECFDNYKQ